MATFKQSVLKKLLLALLASYAIAAPIAKEDVAAAQDEESVAKRSSGSSGNPIVIPPSGTQSDPFDVTFNIAGWPNIAEEDCRIMLCELGGTRLL